MPTVTVNLSDYEQIVAVYESLKNSTLAYDETVKPLLDSLRPLLTTIDSENSLQRYYLSVSWNDLSARPADYAEYPPTEEGQLYSYTAFTKAFVISFVEAQTTRYANILVTDDPSGNVGWQAIDVYFG